MSPPPTGMVRRSHITMCLSFGAVSPFQRCSVSALSMDTERGSGSSPCSPSLCFLYCGKIMSNEKLPPGVGVGTLDSSMTTYFVVFPRSFFFNGTAMRRNSGARTSVSTDQAAQRDSGCVPFSSWMSLIRVTCRYGRKVGSETKLSNCMKSTQSATSSVSVTSALAHKLKPIWAGYSVLSSETTGMPFFVRVSPGSPKVMPESSGTRLCPST
mmetsp:Transcript_19295/g.53916  ORF Transcript_19295/g.53916 Transcript_19295/m.53916 type:complete len:212 (+) Transcript_19295:1516-2151(+)